MSKRSKTTIDPSTDHSDDQNPTNPNKMARKNWYQITPSNSTTTSKIKRQINRINNLAKHRKRTIDPSQFYNDAVANIHMENQQGMDNSQNNQNLGNHQDVPGDGLYQDDTSVMILASNLENEKTLHSGNFMRSKNNDRVPINYKALLKKGREDQFSLFEINNLRRLTYYMHEAFLGGTVINPKWKNFTGLKLRMFDRTRLNNAIWRSWFCVHSPNNAWHNQALWYDADASFVLPENMNKQSTAEHLREQAIKSLRKKLNRQLQARHQTAQSSQFISQSGQPNRTNQEQVLYSHVAGQYWRKKAQQLIKEYKSWRIEEMYRCQLENKTRITNETKKSITESLKKAEIQIKSVGKRLNNNLEMNTSNSLSSNKRTSSTSGIGIKSQVGNTPLNEKLTSTTTDTSLKSKNSKRIKFPLGASYDDAELKMSTNKQIDDPHLLDDNLRDIINDLFEGQNSENQDDISFREVSYEHSTIGQESTYRQIGHRYGLTETHALVYHVDPKVRQPALDYGDGTDQLKELNQKLMVGDYDDEKIDFYGHDEDSPQISAEQYIENLKKQGRFSQSIRSHHNNSSAMNNPRRSKKSDRSRRNTLIAEMTLLPTSQKARLGLISAGGGIQDNDDESDLSVSYWNERQRVHKMTENWIRSGIPDNREDREDPNIVEKEVTDIYCSVDDEVEEELEPNDKLIVGSHAVNFEALQKDQQLNASVKTPKILPSIEKSEPKLDIPLEPPSKMATIDVTKKVNQKNASTIKPDTLQNKVIVKERSFKPKIEADSQKNKEIKRCKIKSFSDSNQQIQIPKFECYSKRRDTEKNLFDKLGQMLGTTLTTSRISRQDSTVTTNKLENNPDNSIAAKVSKAGLLSLTAQKINSMEANRKRTYETMEKSRLTIKRYKDLINAQRPSNSLPNGYNQNISKNNILHNNNINRTGPSTQPSTSNLALLTSDEPLNIRLKSILTNHFKNSISTDWRYYIFLNLIMKPQFSSFCKALTDNPDIENIDSVVKNWANQFLTKKNFLTNARNELVRESKYDLSSAMERQLERVVLNDQELEALFDVDLEE